MTAKRGSFYHGPKSANSSAPKASRSGGYSPKPLKAPKGAGGGQRRDGKGRFA